MSSLSMTTFGATVKPTYTHQPTYRLDPISRFSAEKVENIIRRIVEPELEELEYDDKTIPELSLNLAESIKNSVKEENFTRYRIISVVSIGQKRQQSVEISHSFLWDSERDLFATCLCENNQVYISVVVYGVYID